MWSYLTHSKKANISLDYLFNTDRVCKYLTCDFECVWSVGVDVDLPRSCLVVRVETNSPQVAHCLYGPQFPIGLIFGLRHTWNLMH